MDVSVDTMDDDDVKIPSLKILLFLGKTQQSVVLLLKVLELFILKNEDGLFIVLFQLEYCVRYTIDSFLTSDIAALFLLLYR